MNRCEHGQKITKFCVTEHCHHKQSAGCDYCMKRYHFHLTNTAQLQENNIEQIIKKLTLPTDSKYKTRILQEAAIDYLRTVKNMVNNWFDQAQNAIADRLSHPLLRKQGLLPTYNRLKYREYRKINAKDLRALNEFAKNNTSEQLKKQEVSQYYQEVRWTEDILEAAEKLIGQAVRLPEVKEGQGTIQAPNKNKVKDALDSINRQIKKKEAQDGGKTTSAVSSRPGSIKFEESTLMKRRQGKDERKSAHKNSLALDESSKMESFKPQGQADALANIPLESDREQKERRLKRRRSSIDEKFEPKFNSSVEDPKEVQERKKKLIESVNIEKKKTPSEKNDSIMGDLLSLKYGNRKEETKKEGRKSGELAKKEQNETQYSDEKLNNGLGMMAELMDNILPPLPEPVKKDDSPIVPKVIKIPVNMGEKQMDECQSPIWKKKRQSNKAEASGGFGIKLFNTSEKKNDKAVEPVKNDSLPSVIPVTKAKSKEMENSSPDKYVDDETVELERNEKNSLLLFSEALKEDSQKAIELLKAALKYSPNNLSAAEYLSYLYVQGGRAKECLEVCESILVRIEDTPQQFELTLHLHNNRAAALNMLGRYSESIMVLEKCLRSRRKHYFYKNLADAYFCLGIPEKAAMNYEKAVKLDPEYDEAFYNLAVTQFMQEEYTSALINIREAVRIDGQHENYLELEREIVKRKENVVGI